MVSKLIVKESLISKSGVARIHENVLKQLGVDSGKSIVVSSDNGSILINVYADTLIDKNKISLRPADSGIRFFSASSIRDGVLIPSSIRANIVIYA